MVINLLGTYLIWDGLYQAIYYYKYRFYKQNPMTIDTATPSYSKRLFYYVHLSFLAKYVEMLLGWDIQLWILTTPPICYLVIDHYIFIQWYTYIRESVYNKIRKYTCILISRLMSDLSQMITDTTIHIPHGQIDKVYEKLEFPILVKIYKIVMVGILYDFVHYYYRVILFRKLSQVELGKIKQNIKNLIVEKRWDKLLDISTIQLWMDIYHYNDNTWLYQKLKHVYCFFKIKSLKFSCIWSVCCLINLIMPYIEYNPPINFSYLKDIIGFSDIIKKCMITVWIVLCVHLDKLSFKSFESLINNKPISKQIETSHPISSIVATWTLRCCLCFVTQQTYTLCIICQYFVSIQLVTYFVKHLYPQLISVRIRYIVVYICISYIYTSILCWFNEHINLYIHTVCVVIQLYLTHVCIHYIKYKRYKDPITFLENYIETYPFGDAIQYHSIPKSLSNAPIITHYSAMNPCNHNKCKNINVRKISPNGNSDLYTQPQIIDNYIDTL